MDFFRPKLSVVIAVVSISLVVAAAADDPSANLPSPPTPGRFTLTIKTGGYDRAAQVHIPTGYRSGTKPPLVLLLHGGGGSGTSALDKDGWVAKADKEGFLIVAPEGLGALPKLPTNFKTNPALWNTPVQTRF